MLRTFFLRAFTFGAFLLISWVGHAQLNISTNLRENMVYDEGLGQWEIVSSDKEELTFLEFNADWTMFKHTTPTISSAYIIKSMEHNEGEKTWNFEVKSDVGNAYTVMVDFENEQVVFFAHEPNDDGSLWLVRHSIKHSWFDED